MPGYLPLRTDAHRRHSQRTTGGMPRCRIANAFESSSSEESGPEARLAGHRRAIIRICEKHAFLRGKPLRQDSDVRNGSYNSRSPGGVYEWQGQHLGKYGRVIGMPNVAKRPASHYAEAR